MTSVGYGKKVNLVIARNAVCRMADAVTWQSLANSSEQVIERASDPQFYKFIRLK